MDANVVVAACLAPDGFALFSRHQLLAPDLMWWEAASTLHEYAWRIKADRRTPDMETLTTADVLVAVDRLQIAPVDRVSVDTQLLSEAWAVADACGFARLYDAAYVALARAREATLVTLDGRLLGSPAAEQVRIVGPGEVRAG